MRRTSKVSVCLVLIGLSLMLISSNAVWPQEAKKVSPQVKELKAKRLEVLGEAFTEAKAELINMRIEPLTTLAISAKFFEARREQAETQADRIKVIEEEVQEAENLLEVMKAKKVGARGTRLAVMMSQAYLLEAQIALENAKAGE